ncbi:ParB/RepB/Spo0J family partition protein [Streptosporangium sp. NPDC001559]|uniref:ParB/RepB/Spo0J family partition protein n=1 Tax=Streptosporangium sp. NPDC001559 TaxID=3366187 RepID=UPI0036E9EF10
MTATAMRPDTSKALALLAAGHTIHAVAEHTGWPISAVRGLANGQKGWMIDKNGRVYDPSKPKYKAQVPDDVPTEDLTWARSLLDGTPRTIQFQAPTPATPAAPPKPAPTAAPHPKPPAASSPRPVKGAAAVDLPLAAIHDHPGNIRSELGDLDELAASIAAQGLLQPLTVRPHPAKPGHYELLAGHRRRAAALQAGLTTVPAVIRHDVTDTQAIEVMLVENVQRRDLNPIEKAEALGALRDQGYSGALITARTGIASGTVSYLLALLELDDASKERVRTGELTATDAVAAVRRLRKKAREARAAGSSAVPAWSWEPDYLTTTHPLAKKASRLCQAREHTARRRIGRVACGQCWETVIRGDERVVIATEAEHQGSAS